MFRAKVKVGIIGCGMISEIYLKNCQKFDILQAVACADLDPERAKARANQFNIHACSPEQLLAEPDIEIVVNLTTPRSHAAVSLAILAAGKNLHSEKSLALNREEGRSILDAARAKGLLVGCAPDTFMGGAAQTCRKLLDDGAIGEPVGAAAFLLCHGYESWHQDPEFFYQPGGGPMFEMGPYYLTSLINLIGPVRRVTGCTKTTFAERTITSQKKYGAKIPVQVPTYVTGIMDFANGAIGTIITTFDVWASQAPRIEIYGTEGTLEVPDPNWFEGVVLLRRGSANDTKKKEAAETKGAAGRGAGASEWESVPLSHGNLENKRGLAIADMASALRSGRPLRASGEMAFHVLDIMQSIHESSQQGRHIELTSTCIRPAPLPLGLPENTLDQ